MRFLKISRRAWQDNGFISSSNLLKKMADSVIRQFVAEQRELLNLELQAEEETASAANGPGDEGHASHVLGNLDASDVSVGLYGRTVVELTVWSEKTEDGNVSLLPAHRFTVGDEVEIRSKHNNAKNRYPSGVISAVSDTSVSVALFQDSHRKKKQQAQQETEEGGDEDVLGLPPLSLLPKSSVEVHRKMLQALEKLEKQGVNLPIAGRVVGAMFSADPSRDPPSRISPIEPYNTRLDQSQLEAIAFCLQEDRPVALIHGPPGTGKTTTAAELIYQAVFVHEMKVLVTAPSNVAVDNILERLVQAYEPQSKAKSKRKGNSPRLLRAVRLGHPARIKSSILSYSLEALVQNADGTEIVADVRTELQSFLRILSNPKSKFNDKRLAYRELKSLRKEIRTREEKVVQELINSAQVVLATTVGAANRVLDAVEDGFDLVVIDEAAQALEASCWIPILRAKKVVLAGDHCQLPPTIKSRHHRAQSGLSKTLFERLMELYGDSNHGNNPRISRMLKIQYRMHEDISNWVSQAMYGGELLTHESVKARTLTQLEGIHKGEGEDDISETALLLIDTSGCDMYETVNAAGSRFNEGEAKIVAQHARTLIAMGLQQTDVAIITPYNGQVELLRGMLLLEFPKLEIRSVDGFQGGEREAVILSLVRSSGRGGVDGIGFLRDDRRQNVAITRAKRHLAVVCDAETVCQSKFIKNLITWMEEHGEHRSAMQYSYGSAEKELQRDLQAAEAEIQKMMESEMVASSNKGSSASIRSGIPSTSARLNSEKDNLQLEETKRKSLLDKINAFAQNGAEGEEMSLSSELSSFDRRLVHEFAEQIGLGHKSEGVEGVDRRVILKILNKTTPPVFAPVSDVTKEKDSVEQEMAPVFSSFAMLAAEADSDSDDEEACNELMPVEVSSAEASVPDTNQLLASLALERTAREKTKLYESTRSAASALQAKKKIKSQKLGGSKKSTPQNDDKNIVGLDDMAFLDAQIEKSQNAHGRKVEGSGRGYRTIVNGILNAPPPVREMPKNATAAASLKSKIQQAQESRKAKQKKKK